MCNFDRSAEFDLLFIYIYNVLAFIAGYSIQLYIICLLISMHFCLVSTLLSVIHEYFKFLKLGIVTLVQLNPSLFCHDQDFYLNIFFGSPALCFFTGNTSYYR